jgi:hypothetical protein
VQSLRSFFCLPSPCAQRKFPKLPFFETGVWIAFWGQRIKKDVIASRTYTSLVIGGFRIIYTLMSHKGGKYQKKKEGQKRHCTGWSAGLLLYQKLIDIKTIQYHWNPNQSSIQNRPVRFYPYPEKNKVKSNINQLRLLRLHPKNHHWPVLIQS